MTTEVDKLNGQTYEHLRLDYKDASFITLYPIVLGINNIPFSR